MTSKVLSDALQRVHAQLATIDPPSGEEVTVRGLRDIRRRKFLTIEALAQKAGVSPKTIVDLEFGRTHPKFRTILRISEALGVDPNAVAEFVAAVAPEDEAPSKKLAA